MPSTILDDPRWDQLADNPLKLSQARDLLFKNYVESNPDRAQWYQGQSEESREALKEKFRGRINESHPELFEVEVTPETRKQADLPMPGTGLMGLESSFPVVPGASPFPSVQNTVTVPATTGSVRSPYEEAWIKSIKDGEVPELSRMEQDELAYVAATVAERAPEKMETLGPAIRAQAKQILAERGALLFEPEGDRVQEEVPRLGGGTRTVTKSDPDAFNRAVMNFLSFGSGIGAGPAMDLVEANNEFNKMTGFGLTIDDLNQFSAQTKDNRALTQMAYGDTTQMFQAAGTMLGWLGGSNAVFRQKFGQRFIGKIDEAGKPIGKAVAPFKISPISKTGLAAGLAFDASIGATFGPEFIPSWFAEATGMEQSRIASAIEVGTIGLAIGGFIRSLAQAKTLRAYRKMPQFKDFKGTDGQFRQHLTKLMEDFDEKVRVHRAKQEARGFENARKVTPEETPPVEPTLNLEGTTPVPAPPGKPIDPSTLPPESAVRFDDKARPDAWHIISREPSNPKQWRLTAFDKHGPGGHLTYNTWDEAVKEGLNRGTVQEVRLLHEDKPKTTGKEPVQATDTTPTGKGDDAEGGSPPGDGQVGAQPGKEGAEETPYKKLEPWENNVIDTPTGSFIIQKTESGIQLVPTRATQEVGELKEGTPQGFIVYKDPLQANEKNALSAEILAGQLESGEAKIRAMDRGEKPEGVSLNPFVFVSGLSRSNKDLFAAMSNNEAVGVAVGPKPLTENIRKGLIDYANSNTNSIFVDSGAVKAFNDGVDVDWDKVLFRYKELLSHVNPGSRANFTFVAPDVIGNFDETLRLQFALREHFQPFLDEGARLLIGVQRVEGKSLFELDQAMRQVYNDPDDRVVTGVPFHDAPWSHDEVMDFIRETNSHLKETNPTVAKYPDAAEEFSGGVHLLGGGEKAVRKIQDQMEKEGLFMFVSGDAGARAVMSRKFGKKADKVVTARNKAYESLWKKGTPVGPDTVELGANQVTVAMLKRLRLPKDQKADRLTRPEPTDEWVLLRKDKVTGVPSDNGWILRNQKARTEGRTAPVSQGSRIEELAEQYAPEKLKLPHPFVKADLVSDAEMKRMNKEAAEYRAGIDRLDKKGRRYKPGSKTGNYETYINQRAHLQDRLDKISENARLHGRSRGAKEFLDRIKAAKHPLHRLSVITNDYQKAGLTLEEAGEVDKAIAAEFSRWVDANLKDKLKLDDVDAAFVARGLHANAVHHDFESIEGLAHQNGRLEQILQNELPGDRHRQMGSIPEAAVDESLLPELREAHKRGVESSAAKNEYIDKIFPEAVARSEEIRANRKLEVAKEEAKADKEFATREEQIFNEWVAALAANDGNALRAQFSIGNLIPTGGHLAKMQKRFLELEKPPRLNKEHKFDTGSIEPGPLSLKPITAGVRAAKDPLDILGPATSRDETRFVLTGVHFDADKQRIIATDGRQAVIIPWEVGETSKTVSAWKGKLPKVQGGLVAKGKEIDANFPNVDQVIPKDYTSWPIKFDQDLRDLHQHVATGQRANNWYITDKQDLTIQVVNDEGLSVEAFNPEFLGKVTTSLLRAGIEKVRIHVKDSEMPMVITTKEGAAAIIMPVRLNDASKGSEAIAYEGAYIPWKIPEGTTKAKRPARRTRQGSGASQPASISKKTLPRRIDDTVEAPFGLDPATGKPLSVHDIRRFIAKAFDIPVRKGVNRKQALGYFDTKAEVIRMKDLSNLRTIFHESGHYFHRILLTPKTQQYMSLKGYNKFNKKYDAELLDLGERTSRESYSTQQIRMEGVAEFVAYYMTDPQVALKRAPAFYDFFENVLKGEYPEIWNLVLDSQALVKEYIEQPALAKVKSMIVDRTRPKRPIRETMEKLFDDWVTMLAPLERSLDKLVEFGLNPARARQIKDMANNHIGGWRGKAETSLYHKAIDLDGNEVGESLAAILEDAVGQGSLADSAAYMVALRALELNRRGLKSGFDSRDAQEVVDALKGKYEPIRLRALRYQRYQRNLLVEAGILAPSDAAKMDALNEAYVPFYRFYESVRGGRRPKAPSTKFVDTPKGVRRFFGSEREVLNPWESMIYNTYLFRELADSNVVGKAFTDAVTSVQGGGRIADKIVQKVAPTTIPSEEILAMLKKKGLAEFLTSSGVVEDEDLLMDTLEAFVEGNPVLGKLWRATRTSSAKDGIYRIWRNGKEEFYQLDDPELYRALSLSDAADTEIIKRFPLMKAWNLFTRVKRGGATLTLEFIAKNPIRDQITAGVFSKNGYVPFYDMFRGAFHLLKRDDLYWNWVKGGGKYSDFLAADRTDLTQTLTDLIRDQSALAQALYLANPINVLNNLQRASGLMENATRISEYARAIAKGKSPLKAAADSTDVTLKFSRFGFKGKMVNMFSAFFNAGVQDMDKVRRTFGDMGTEEGRNKAARAFALAFGLITTPSVITWYMGKDDEEIQNLPAWRKAFFWNVNLTEPFKSMGLIPDDENFILTFPKPFLIGQIFGTAPVVALEYIDKKDPKALLPLVTGLAHTLPLSSQITEVAPIPFELMPDMFRPTVENLANHKFFFEGPVVTDPNLPAPMQSNVRTSKSAQFLAQQIAKGGVDISPEKIDNFIIGTTAGLGRYGLTGVDYFLWESRLAEIPPKPKGSVWDLPGIRSFRINPIGTPGILNRFYEASEKAEEATSGYHELRDGNANLKDQIGWWTRNEDRAMWYARSLHSESTETVVGKFRKARLQMGERNRRVAAILADHDMTPEEKRAEILFINEQRRDIAGAAMSRWVYPADR